MGESLADLQRRFLELAGSAEEMDAELGKQLWSLLVSHEWFRTQLNNCVNALVRRWGGNSEDVKDITQDVVLQLRHEMQKNPTLNLDVERAGRMFRAYLRHYLQDQRGLCRVAIGALVAG